MSSNETAEPKPPIVLGEPDKAVSPQESAAEAPEVNIKFDGKTFTIVIPVIIGKMGVYGAIQLVHEEAQKFFYAQEMQARKQREASRLHIPGGRSLQ